MVTMSTLLVAAEVMERKTTVRLRTQQPTVLARAPILATVKVMQTSTLLVAEVKVRVMVRQVHHPLCV
jgi:hypothetical protein